jgi:hypothetical protein
MDVSPERLQRSPTLGPLCLRSPLFARKEQERTLSRWSRKFDHPIVLDDKTLITLRDAANHILALPEKQFAREHWQTALRELSISAESGGSVRSARITVVTALNIDGQYRRKPATRHRIR